MGPAKFWDEFFWKDWVMIQGLGSWINHRMVIIASNFEDSNPENLSAEEYIIKNDRKLYDFLQLKKELHCACELISNYKGYTVGEERARARQIQRNKNVESELKEIQLNAKGYVNNDSFLLPSQWVQKYFPNLFLYIKSSDRRMWNNINKIANAYQRYYREEESPISPMEFVYQHEPLLKNNFLFITQKARINIIVKGYIDYGDKYLENILKSLK